jgi:hypothetical protein
LEQTEYDVFQEIVTKHLVRHRSILDVLSKFQESSARVNRAVSKAVTECGCLQINASRQQAPNNIDFRELKDHMASHLEGELCENCREVLEAEVGRTLFYLAAVCDLNNLSLQDIMTKECQKISALGPFNLT